MQFLDGQEFQTNFPTPLALLPFTNTIYNIGESVSKKCITLHQSCLHINFNSMRRLTFVQILSRSEIDPASPPLLRLIASIDDITCGTCAVHEMLIPFPRESVLVVLQFKGSGLRGLLCGFLCCLLEDSSQWWWIFFSSDIHCHGQMLGVLQEESLPLNSLNVFE